MFCLRRRHYIMTGRQREDEVITHQFVSVWQHHAEDIRPMTEKPAKALTHTCTPTHTHTSTRTRNKNEEICPHSEDGSARCYRKNVHIALKRDRKEEKKKQPLHCISAVFSQLIARCDILAIKKWYMRTHNPPLFFFLKKKKKKRSENIHK